ncbi:MAG TPA: isoprenylcysteine carboxylmethyltransferase family protein [Nitrospirota bacterium]|nr:isoprenylcysteine carboxylmethyltransferase family protein [Nitrospirota bacterium]
MNTKKTLLRSSIVLYFIIAFEVLIMISPFAGLFYSVFNPVLLKLAASSPTRWLSAFYLPHMVLPRDGLLQFVRVMGSVLFVAGVVVFLACAARIYTAKFRKKGAVLGGLYAYIRHPQYLALGVSGLGLSILWPRFLTVVLWILMTIVYYFLAKDEERRMLDSHEETYRAYMSTTGMFLPRGIERTITPSSVVKKAALMAGFVAVTLGCAVLLRAYTISTLTMWTGGKNVTAVAILPEDGLKMDHRMADILAVPQVKERLRDNKQYLVYFLPQNYIMQGMIADTGGDWKLYKQNHSIAMITDWIFHPFRHLREGDHAMHNMHMQHQGVASTSDGVTRRLIFLSIEDAEVKRQTDLFSINALRVPQFMVDADVHTMRIIEVKELSHGSGWGSVPTPVF